MENPRVHKHYLSQDDVEIIANAKISHSEGYYLMKLWDKTDPDCPCGILLKIATWVVAFYPALTLIALLILMWLPHSKLFEQTTFGMSSQ
jgi:hypothetical protein